MRTSFFLLLLAALPSVGCSANRGTAGDSSSLTSAQAAAVDQGVRAFMQTVAYDVTHDGPSAWRTHFADDPAFFMAVDGRMALPNSAAARATIDTLVRDTKSIDLQWGGELRVDPLTNDFAVVAAPYHEVLVSTAGKRVDEEGFFTGTAENRDGRWQFRNAHWSDPVQTSPVSPPPPLN
jgi:hypothetical protein